MAPLNHTAVLELADRGGWDVEPDADIAAGRRIDRGVHADDLTFHIKGWTAGVAPVDRRVDLQENGRTAQRRYHGPRLWSLASCTIFTLTATTAGFTRAISEANEGMA